VDGRVAGRTRVQRSNAEDWLPAARLTELQPEVGHADAVAEAAAAQGGSGGLLAAARRAPRGFFGVVRPLVAVVGLDSKNLQSAAAGLQPGESERRRDEGLLWLGLASTLLWFAYSVPLNGRYGATLGKLMLGAKIVRLDGTRIGYRLALVRFFGTQVSQLVFGAGYLCILFRKDKRRCTT